jgi:formylglycine-generating enzyme required for sulfatase activity
MAVSVDFSVKASTGALKRIPSGYLKMGSRFHAREQSRRSVYVAEFDMAHAPVTVTQFAAFLNTGAVKQKKWWSQEGWEWLGGRQFGWGRENRWQPETWENQRQRPYHPVVGITWHEACAYCSWVSHEKECLVRLPTEEEWEYAARGDDGRPYPWGEYFDATLTNTLEAGRYDTVEVTSIPGDSSPFEVMDMAGNVQEWTSSDYSSMPGEQFYDRTLKVVRGGSFDDTSFGSRTSYRRAYPPGYYYSFLGFRVVVAQR